MKISDETAWNFYAEEWVKSAWSVRQLEWQIHTMYYQRILASQDKVSVAAEIQTTEPKPEFVLCWSWHHYFFAYTISTIVPRNLLKPLFAGFDLQFEQFVRELLDKDWFSTWPHTWPYSRSEYPESAEPLPSESIYIWVERAETHRKLLDKRKPVPSEPRGRWFKSSHSDEIQVEMLK